MRQFGEFNDYKELNQAAAGLKAEGDQDSLYKLAEENGLERADVDDYLAGYMEELTTIYTAAFGELVAQEKEDIESKKSLIEKMPLRVIMTMLRGMCTEEEVAVAVKSKGKRVSEIYKAMRAEAEKNKTGSMGVSCGTDRELCEIIREYYLGTKETFQKKLEDLYR
jgi:hypothetical protein